MGVALIIHVVICFFKDHVLLEEMAHFDRERIPERVVHAKGAGAFGYFEVLLTFI